ncbi:MAG: hypothetical protein PHY47_00305 [Lachnospiraceae bacterium]|nr:hypothetical protein [Lachnospiraceae bacterium]
MAIKDNKLKDLTPLNVDFLAGESPTSEKLEGMMTQVQKGLEYIENMFGDAFGEEEKFNTWMSTLARDLGDRSEINPLIIPNQVITYYQQNLTPGKVEHELDFLPVGDFASLISTSLDASILPGQYKASIELLEKPGDWTIGAGNIIDGKLVRSRKLVTHSPAEGNSIVFSEVTTGKGSSTISSLENVIPNIAQAKYGGPFLNITLADAVTNTYIVNLPLRTKMFDEAGDITDYSASNTKHNAGINSQHELPPYFFDSTGLALNEDDPDNGGGKVIPLNLIKIYNWDTKKEIEGIVRVKASPIPEARRYQFMLQLRIDVLLNSSGRYLLVVPGNTITNQLKGLSEEVFNNRSDSASMARLIKHKDLIGLRTSTLDVSNRSKYYGPSNIDANDHSQYLHRNGFTDADKGAGGNILRGNLVIGNKDLGSSDTIHEHFNVNTDSFKLHFGNVAKGPALSFDKIFTHNIDHSYGGLPLSWSDTALLLEGAVSDSNPAKKNIVLDGEVRTTGSVILGKLASDTIYMQGKLYINDEVTLIPRAKAGITGEAGKMIYDSSEKTILVHNGTSWTSSANQVGYSAVIGDGVTTFGKYNGTNITPFNAAIAEVTSTGGTIKILPGNYNLLTNTIQVPANVRLEGSGIKTILTGTGNTVETIGANASIQNLSIKNASTGLLVSESGTSVRDVIFSDCTKAIDITSAATGLQILEGVIYDNCTETTDFSGTSSILTNENVTKNATAYAFGSTVNDWSIKEELLKEYIPTSGNIVITLDKAAEGAIGLGAFKVTGTGTFICKKMLPVNPNVGLGGHINIRRLGTIASVSVGVNCYGADYTNLGTRNFLLSNAGIGNATMDLSFTKRIMTGIGTDTYSFPAGTRFIQPIITIVSNNSGILFDSFEIMNLGYARDISTYGSYTVTGTDIDWSLGNVFHKTITANTTFTFSNMTEGKVVSVVVRNSGAANRTIAFPSGIYKDAGIILTIIPGMEHVYTFIRVNGNTYVSFLSHLTNV